MPKPIMGLLTDTHLTSKTIDTVISIFKQFVQECMKRNVKHATFLGDWFTDRSGQSFDCQSVTRGILDYLTEFDIRWFFIHGNHDQQDLSSKYSFLNSYFPTNYQGNVELIEGSKRCSLKSIDRNIIWHWIPFYEHQTYRKHLAESQAFIKQYSGNHLLLTHKDFNGAKNNDGSIVEDAISQKEVAGFKQVKTGHYHDEAIIGNIHYIGSAYQGNFGERESHKGFTFINSDLTFEQAQAHFPHYQKLYVPVQDKKQLCKALKDLACEQNDKAFLEIVFQGNQSELESIDPTEFRKLGINVKFQNTVERPLRPLEEIGSESVVFDKNSILRSYNEYSIEQGFTLDEKKKGLKRLKKHI